MAAQDRFWPARARGVGGDRQRVLPTRCRRSRVTVIGQP